MTPAARIQAAIEVLDEVQTGKPAEQALTGWARRSRFAGSGDRAAVRDHVFGVLRRWRSCARLGGSETGRGLMIGALRADGLQAEDLFTGARFAPDPMTTQECRTPDQPTGAEALDLPDWLMPELERSLGPRLEPVAQALRHRAPVHARVNQRRASREAAIAALEADGIGATAHPVAPVALEIGDGARRLRQSRAFRDGWIELQDAASQAAVAALPIAPGLRVLDYCAGGGGKALALADMGASVTAHDADPARMRDLPVRAARAGVDISCVARVPDNTDFDLVLCDVPCSGSGAWRRSPEGKWRLTPARLEQLNETQDAILETAAAICGPDTSLAYVTCSVLACENADRVRSFLETHPGWSLSVSRTWLPDEGTDGFALNLLTRVR